MDVEPKGLPPFITRMEELEEENKRLKKEKDDLEEKIKELAKYFAEIVKIAYEQLKVLEESGTQEELIFVEDNE